MKKLIALAAVATCGAALAVESANIVGYATRDINNKFKMAAAQFETVSGETVSINGAITLPASAAVQCWDDDYDSYDYKDGWMDSAPQIQVPKVGAIGYNYYYFVSDARGADESNVGAGWVDSTGYLTANSVPAGFGIWVRGFVNGSEEVEDVQFTFSGAVNGDDTQSVQCENMFKLRALPYPTSPSLNANIANWSAYLTPVQCWDDDYDSYDYKDGWMETAPQIQVPKTTGSGYNYYYYVSDARGSDESNVGAGWVDSTGYLTSSTIPVAYGLWINARTAEPVNIPFNL